MTPARPHRAASEELGGIGCLDCGAITNDGPCPGPHAAAPQQAPAECCQRHIVCPDRRGKYPCGPLEDADLQRMVAHVQRGVAEHGRGALRAGSGESVILAIIPELLARREALTPLAGERPADVKRERDELRAALANVTTERDEARDWVRRLTDERRVLTCAFCGQGYPPGTPESNHEALTEHVMVCQKHPMREVKRRVQGTEALLRSWAAGGRPLEGTLAALSRATPEPSPEEMATEAEALCRAAESTYEAAYPETTVRVQWQDMRGLDRDIWMAVATRARELAAERARRGAP